MASGIHKLYNIAVDVRALDAKHVTGVDTYLRELLLAWLDIDHGCEFHLLGTKSTANHPLIKQYIQRGHKHITHPFPSKLFNLLMQLHVLSLNKIIPQADIYFLPNSTFANFNKNSKVVLTFHDLFFAKYKLVYSLWRRFWHKIVNPKRLADISTKLIAVSQAASEDLQQIYKIDKSKIKVIPLGVKADQKAPNKNIDLDIPSGYILFLGSLEPRKNVISLLYAYAELKKDFPHLCLVLAGGTIFPQKDNKSFKYANQLEDVYLLGSVSHQQKLYLYKNARAVILPSLYEGFGLPIIEAQAAETPVITCTSSSMPEAAAGGAILVNALNISDLYLAIKELLKDQRMKDRLIQQGNEHIKNLTWNNTAMQTLNIIKQSANRL